MPWKFIFSSERLGVYAYVHVWDSRTPLLTCVCVLCMFFGSGLVNRVRRLW